MSRTVYIEGWDLEADVDLGFDDSGPDTSTLYIFDVKIILFGQNLTEAIRKHDPILYEKIIEQYIEDRNLEDEDKAYDDWKEFQIGKGGLQK